MIRAFIRYYFRRNVRNWRALRKVCMAQLPKIDQKLEGTGDLRSLEIAHINADALVAMGREIDAEQKSRQPKLEGAK